MYKTEKDISIPSIDFNPPTLGSTQTKYPFKKMEVNESFFVPLNGELRHLIQNRILGSCRYHRLKPKKFTTRYIKSPIEGIRCWRIK